MRNRILSLTPEHIQRVSRQIPADSGDKRLTPVGDDDLDQLTHELLRQNSDGPIWLFAFGSLIWKPAFEYVDAQPCIAHGWRRSFCLIQYSWRGTPDIPGLMLALDRGGSCVGMAYRMPDDDPYGRMLRLLKREISWVEDLPWLRWLTIRMKGTAVRALTFYCAPRDDEDLIRLPIGEQAARIARAAGPAGSCAEYLLNTVSHLEALGIRDRYLWTLQRLVAIEIDGLSGQDGSVAASSANVAGAPRARLYPSP